MAEDPIGIAIVALLALAVGFYAVLDPLRRLDARRRHRRGERVDPALLRPPEAHPDPQQNPRGAVGCLLLLVLATALATAGGEPKALIVAGIAALLFCLWVLGIGGGGDS